MVEGTPKEKAGTVPQKGTVEKLRVSGPSEKPAKAAEGLATVKGRTLLDRASVERRRASGPEDKLRTVASVGPVTNVAKAIPTGDIKLRATRPGVKAQGEIQRDSVKAGVQPTVQSVAPISRKQDDGSSTASSEDLQTPTRSTIVRFNPQVEDVGRTKTPGDERLDRAIQTQLSDLDAAAYDTLAKRLANILCIRSGLETPEMPAAQEPLEAELLDKVQKIAEMVAGGDDDLGADKGGATKHSRDLVDTRESDPSRTAGGSTEDRLISLDRLSVAGEPEVEQYQDGTTASSAPGSSLPPVSDAYGFGELNMDDDTALPGSSSLGAEPTNVSTRLPESGSSTLVPDSLVR